MTTSNNYYSGNLRSYLKPQDSSNPCMRVDRDTLLLMLADIRTEALLADMYHAGAVTAGRSAAKIAQPYIPDNVARSFNAQVNEDVSTDLKAKIAAVSPLKGEGNNLLENLRVAIRPMAGHTLDAELFLAAKNRTLQTDLITDFVRTKNVSLFFDALNDSFQATAVPEAHRWYANATPGVYQNHHLITQPAHKAA